MTRSSVKISFILLVLVVASLHSEAQNPAPPGFQVVSATWKASPIISSCGGFTDTLGRAWTDLAFDDSTWSAITPPDAGSFNTPGLGPADRFYRGSFNVSSTAQPVFLFFVSDDSIEIFVNGTSIGSFSPFAPSICHQLGCVNISGCGPGFNVDVPPVQVPANLLRSGTNVVAAHVSNGGGGSYFDMAVLTRSAPLGGPFVYDYETQNGSIGTDNGGGGFNGPLGLSIRLGHPNISVGPTSPIRVQFFQNGTSGCSDPGYSFQAFADSAYTIPVGTGFGIGNYTDASGSSITIQDFNGAVSATASGAFDVNNYYTFSFGSCDFSRAISIRGDPSGSYTCTQVGGPFGAYCYQAYYQGAFPYLIVSTAPSPVITSISHGFGTQGQIINNFTVNGNNFQASSVLSFRGSGITVNSYSLRTPSLIVANITILNAAPIGPQDSIVTNSDSQQSAPGGPFTVLQAPSGQIMLTPQNAPATRSALLTPPLPTRNCTNTDSKLNPIKGNTGEVTLVAKVRTVDNRPAALVPISFQVIGPNSAASKISQTTKAGRAVFTYSGTPKIYQTGEKDLDIITISAPVGPGGSTVTSEPIYMEWGQVTIALKMPLPENPLPRWKVTTRINDPSDVAHQCNGYYSLDLVDETAGSEVPVIASLGGTATVSLDPTQSTFGTFSDIDHGNEFETIYAHLDTPTVQIQDGSISLGQMIAAMGETGKAFGVHLHFQIRYSGTSGRNDNLRIYVEQQRVEDYCVNGQPDINNEPCTTTKYSSTNNGLPFGAIDSPQANDTVNSTISVSGWVLDDGSVNSVKVLVDGAPIGTAVYGSPRTDICNAPGSLFTWSGFLSCPSVGFSSQLDTTTLTNGVHQLSVSAVDNNGVERVIQTIPVMVSNLVFLVDRQLERGVMRGRTHLLLSAAETSRLFDFDAIE